MHLWHLSSSVAALLSFSFHISCTTASSLGTIQAPWQAPHDHTESTTLVDALSADPDYTSLIHLLQRARLIPTLNRLNGSTLFAPTNDAIKKQASVDPLWGRLLEEDAATPLADNVQEKLRQQLFYHLLNHTISQFPPGTQPATFDTLHFPHKPVDPPSKEPPPYPPWMPIPGGTLGGSPQRLRAAKRGEEAFIGVDVFGNGGAKIVKDRVDGGNGILFGIDDMLIPPSDLSSVIAGHPNASYFHKVLTPDIQKLLRTEEAVTLFLPVNSAWDELDPYERLYLESEYATDDLNRILDMHAVLEKGVRWSDTLKHKTNLTTIDGTELTIKVSGNTIKVSSAELLHPDIYASNGVVHLVSKLLVPPDALKLTPEKYLLALNCTRFVSLLHSVNLTYLINDTDATYTILAPPDDVLSVFADEELPKPGTPELKKLLQYHFIPGKWATKKLESGMLLETVLEEEGLNDGKQVLSVEVATDDKDKKKPPEKSVRFGGAGVIGEPIEVGEALIYFVSRPLVTPVDPLQTALPSLELSSFLAAVFSTTKAEFLRTKPRTTLLLPHNSAFKRLGLLVSAHLLSASAKPDLEQVLLHHAIDGVEYSKIMKDGSQHTFPTLEGSDLQLERFNNGSILVSPSGGWAGMRAELYPRDLLTQTGVIHELSDILIPRSVHLTIGKLVKAAKGSIMATMVNKAGFDWVLEGNPPPEGSLWAEDHTAGHSWTLLCPQDDAFKEFNLTELYADTDTLRAIVMQHMILTKPNGKGEPNTSLLNDPLNNNRPLSLDPSITYSTLRSPSSDYGDLVFRQLENDTSAYVVGIKGARGTGGNGDWARVLSWGRSTTGGGTGGVIQIDRLLVPYQPSPWVEYGGPVFVGIIGVVLICGFFYGVRIIWQRDTLEATYEPSDDAPSAETARVSAADNIKSFIAGGFGGVAAVLVGHPFDLTKTRLQTAPPGTYTGAFDVVKKTLARDGITGLYRGMVPPLLGVTPIFAVSFWAYDASKQLILALTPNRASSGLSIGELATAGFLSAVPTTLVTAPVERAKVLLQVQGQGGAQTQYKGVADVIKHLYKEGGVRSIYRGTGATLARDGPGSAAYFAAYEITKRALTPAGSSPADLNLGAIVVAGGSAGIAMWAIAIPPDVLKSRLQSAPTGTYSGIVDCARKTIAQDGLRALWKGFGPAMARAFPANAATFLGVEASRKVLDSLF
ncbi:hypothetical protein AX16_009746 [Volvariella volvacea WC 439]|nr:hypothetical protein AX16_009746 [Volvariella volvacea WC 439]